MIRVIKQYGISILLLILAIFCLFNIGQNIQDAFTVVTNSLALLLAVVYFVNFERDIIIKIKSFVLNIKWPFRGKTKKILTNVLNFIVKKRWDIISYLFIFLLFLITLVEFSFLEKFINLSWINKYQVILTVLAILSGGLTFWHNRERVEKESEEEQNKEKLAEQKRKEEFPQKYPKINKIPVFRNLIKWMYKERFVYFFGLLLILIIFTFLKAPFFNDPFTGAQSKKYNSSVEPAMYMAEYNNPLISIKKYLANPISNPIGNFQGYLQPPLIEWGLATIYKTFPNNSIEFNTRIFMNIVGILLLISIFIFLKKIITTKESLLVTFLISINPITNLCSYSTVYDGMMIVFAFISLSILIKFLKEKKFSTLLYSSAIFGLSASMKYSIFVWLTPLSLILIYFYLKDKTETLKSFLIYNSMPLIILMIVRVSFKNISIQPLKSILILFLLFILYLVINILANQYKNKLKNLTEKLLKNKFLLIIFLFLVTFLLSLYIKIFNIKTSIFLTSSKIIFEPKVYEYIINLISTYSSNIILSIGLIGIILTIFFGKNQKSKILILGLSIASIFYLIVASKVIFFHEYYTLVFQLTLTIALVHLLNNLLKILTNSKSNKVLIFTFITFLLITLTTYLVTETKALLSSNSRGHLEASEYLITNTEVNDFFIPQYSTNFFSIYTKRPSLDRFSYIETEEVKNKIKEKGLKLTMDELNIKYIISTRQTVDVLPFANLFSDEKLISSDLGDTREITILNKVNLDYVPNNDLLKKMKIVEENDIRGKIKLEQKIGDYYFYIFTD